MSGFAGQGGNGGDAVVCKDGSVRLLDYVEGEFYGQKISLEGKSTISKIMILNITNYIKTFCKNILFIYSINE